jgi:hypothetical protein
MGAFEPLVQTNIAKTLRQAAIEQNASLEIAGRYVPCDMVMAFAFDGDGDQWVLNTARSYSRVEVPLGSMDLQAFGNEV